MIHHDRVKVLNYSIRTNTILVTLHNRDVAKPLSACLYYLKRFKCCLVSSVRCLSGVCPCVRNSYLSKSASREEPGRRERATRKKRTGIKLSSGVCPCVRNSYLRKAATGTLQHSAAAMMKAAAPRR